MDDTFTEAPAPIVGSLGKDHHVSLAPVHDSSMMDSNGHIMPTEEELATLRRVAGTMPISAYLLCGVEFAERASYYGCKQVFKNFIRAPLPTGGNGAGATARGSQDTAGALGKGTVIASAMTDAFTFLAVRPTCLARQHKNMKSLPLTCFWDSMHFLSSVDGLPIQNGVASRPSVSVSQSAVLPTLS